MKIIQAKTEKEDFKNQLIDLSKIYSMITINIKSFNRLLCFNGEGNFLTPITKTDILKQGFYGSIGNMKIMVRKDVEENKIEIEEINEFI